MDNPKKFVRLLLPFLSNSFSPPSGAVILGVFERACRSLASALSSVSDHGGIIQAVRRRFDEREETCAKLSRVAEETRVEQESRAQTNRAQSDRESNLRKEVGGRRHQYLLC